MLGNWLEGSGWTSALVQADIASAGTADSFIKVNHVTKTRHAHQVTAACIHALLKQAYDEYTSESGVNLPLEKWCLSQAQQSLMFSYWLKALYFCCCMLGLFGREIFSFTSNPLQRSLPGCLHWTTFITPGGYLYIFVT